MNLDYANLERAYQEHRSENENVVLEIMSSARYILGKETEEFETNLRQFVGVENALGCSSGTDALLLAMMSLGIRSGELLGIQQRRFSRKRNFCQ